MLKLAVGEVSAMVGPLSYLDLALIGIPLLLGLLAMWSGATRAVFSFPVRLLVSCLLASFAILFVQLSLPTLLDATSALLGLPKTTAQALIGGVGFLVLLVIIFVLLSRIRIRVLGSVSTQSVSVTDRLLGFVFGAAAGIVMALFVVVPSYMELEAFFPDPKQRAPWVDQSISLPLIKRVSDGARSFLGRYVPNPLALEK